MKPPRKRDSAPPGLTPRTRHLLAVAALCAIVLAAYATCFTAGFTLDNRDILLEDPRIRAATAENLHLILERTYWWPYGESGLYRPFATLTYLFNYAILGNAGRPEGYHWVNLLLHAGNVLLLYALLRRVLREFWRAFFAAALWAVHPVLTESVTNMVGRADLLAGMAVLGGLLAYLKSAESGGWRRWAWLGGLMAWSVAGVFSKESAVAIVGVIALYELAWWKERKRGRALLLGWLATAPALAALWWQRAAVLAQTPPVEFPVWDNPLAGAGFWTAKLTAVQVLARYMGLLAWPLHLSCDYSWAQIPLSSGSARDWLSWMAVAAAGAGVVWLYRIQRTLFFFAGLAFATMLITSNLLFPIGTIMAERFLYLPAIALAVYVVLGIYRTAGRFAPAALCAILLLYGLRTVARNADWQDELSLTAATVGESPNSYKAHKLRAAALYEADASHANIDQAIAEAEKAVAILGGLPSVQASPESYQQAGQYYLVKGDRMAAPGGQRAYERALELLTRCQQMVQANYQETAAKARARGQVAPEIDPTKQASLQSAIAYASMRLNQKDRGQAAAAAAVELDPLNGRAYQQLAESLLAGGKADEAAVALTEGALITGDMRLRQRVIDLYREGLDTEGCAIVAGPNGPALDANCAVVRRHTCAGAEAALGVYTRLRRGDLASKLKDAMEKSFGCRQ
jgi:hypothetical protein